MCHVIGNCDSVEYGRIFLRGNVLAAGIKEVDYCDGRLYDPYMDEATYAMRRGRIGYALSCPGAVRHKPLLLSLSRGIATWTRTRTGIYITPLKPRLITFPHYFLAAFLPQDIIFFDGYVVSVRRFIIVDPAYMRKHGFWEITGGWSHDELAALMQRSWECIAKKGEQG